MKSILTDQQKNQIIKYVQFKRLVRNLRRDKLGTANIKKTDNSIEESTRS